MRYLVTILALVPSIAHAYFNSILNESTIYQNKIITNNYQKYAAVTLLKDEQGGLQSHSVSTPKCGKDEELYQGKCQSIECRDKYPFTLPPDTNKGYVAGYICLGIKRFAYSSCKEDIGWIAEMNKYNRIQDCVERPGKEEYPLYPKDVVNIKDYAKTDCKYFGGVERCRINSCNDGWDAKRNSAGKIIKCEIHTCSSEYYINIKPDESIGALLPPCKAGHVTFYGYKTCNKGYSGPVKGQCKLKTCSASDGYVYTTGPITGCKSGETCYSGSSTYHRCTEVNTGYCMNADGYVNPCQCGEGYVYDTFEIEGCKLVSEPCLSGDKKLYKCLEEEDPCEGFTETDPSKLSCPPKFLKTCVKNGVTYYRCNKPSILTPICSNIIEFNNLIPSKCYVIQDDGSCLFRSDVGCPVFMRGYKVGTIVKKEANSVVDNVIVAGDEYIDNNGNKTTTPVTWEGDINPTAIITKNSSSGLINTEDLYNSLNATSIIGTPINGVKNYEPLGCQGNVYCGKGKWFLPSKEEIDNAINYMMDTHIASNVYMTSTEVKVRTLTYMAASKNSANITNIIRNSIQIQHCTSGCTREAYIVPFFRMADFVQVAPGDDKPEEPTVDSSDDDNDNTGNSSGSTGAGNNYGSGSGGGGAPYIDGPVTDINTDINSKYDGIDEGLEYFHRVQ